MTIITFDGIAMLTPGQEVRWDDRFGSTWGYVAEVVPGEYVAIYNGARSWQFREEHFSTGFIVVECAA